MIEKFTNTPELEKEPVAETEKAPESLEDSTERVKELEGRRAEVLDGFLTSKLTDQIANWTPLGVPKMAIEAALAKTTSGHELSGIERVVYGLESVALLVVYATIAQEMRGDASGEMEGAAFVSKVFANMSHLYINKEFVMEQLSKLPDYAESLTAVAQSIGKGLAYVPDAAFTNQQLTLSA